MKIQKPFFRNALKNIFKNKIQFITVVILLFISSLVLTMCYSATSRINRSYENFISEKNSNLHDFVVDLSSTSYVSSEANEDKINFNKISNSDIRDSLIMDYIVNKLANSEYSIDIDRVETRNFTLSSNKNIKAIGLNPEQKVDKFIVNKGMSLETWKTYSRATNNLTLKWVYLDERFAKQNNIKINDIVRLEDDTYGSSVLVKNSENKDKEFDEIIKQYENQDINMWIDKTQYNSNSWFQVVGFGNSSDYITPIINAQNPLPDYNKECLAYVNPLNFGIDYKYYETIFSNNEYDFKNYTNTKIWYTDNEILNFERLRVLSESDKEIYFVGDIKNNNKAESIKYINNILTNMEFSKDIGLKSNFINSLNPDKSVATLLGDDNYKMSSRTNTFPIVVLLFNIVSYGLMAVILGIGLIILITQLKMQIEKAFGQMGVLISLGYKKMQLILSNSLYPLLITLTGGILGYILGLTFQWLIVILFKKFFAINIEPFSFDWKSCLMSIIGMFIFLEAVTLITCFVMFSKNTTLEMINFEQRSATNKFNLFFKKIFTRGSKKFNLKFAGAILSGSLLKLLAVFSALFVSSTMITIAVIVPNMLNENKKYMYYGDEYDNKVSYYSPMYNSPLSFYKTYNPDASQEDYDSLSASDKINKLINNQTSAKFYTPSNDLGELNNMTYKSFDIDYLKNKDLKLQNGSELLVSSLTGSLWPDLYKYVKQSWLEDKKTFMDVLFDNVKSKEQINDLENLRLFYLKYRNTIGLNLKKDGYFDTQSSFLEKLSEDGGKDNDMITKEEFKNYANYSGSIFIEKNGRIRNDDNYEYSLYDYIDNDMRWLSDAVSICGPIYNWIVAYFRNNLQQSFLQGIYTNMPSNVREIIFREFNKEKGNFNLGFGITPFNNDKEELGTYLNSVINNVGFKVFGINQNGLQKLYNKKNEDIKNLLTEENSIIINETLAKNLNIEVGQTIDVDHIVEYLKKDDKELAIDSWKTDKMDAYDSNKYTSAKNLYKSNVLNQNDNPKGWENTELNQDDTVDPKEKNLVYYSKIDLNSDNKVSPTNMAKQIKDGHIKKANKIISNNYKVVGIANQYGNAKAWIDNQKAIEQAQFEKTKPLLFSLFIKEWLNPQGTVSTDDNFFIQKIKGYEKQNNKNNYESNYKNFVEWTNSNDNYKKYLKLFESEYPMFNYKSSNDSRFTDYSLGVSSIQRYGDYSVFGLKGGKTLTPTEQSYAALSQSSITDAWTRNAVNDVLNRINSTLTTMITIFLMIVMLIGLIVILLTINSVIFKNQKIIAMMKILGYNKTYIMRLFIGIYVPSAVFGSCLGFLAGWFILKSALLSATDSILLPYNFYIWYLVVGVLGTLALYLLSVIISWSALKKVNMLIAVQGG
ncbi:ABC transporter permease [Spiroplasma gladiatoris]|uniref:ABC transporter permease n=1 Tax=Spiroplasma gladiatoris TaxID=2143 RepID=A0A4P7AI08_9MOLU|nr:FtsX-like permease family protein [Spiroplasma gladiatoris]QBQ07328.1 ABC transporter permease [Spiroplasma gladiatoris]